MKFEAPEFDESRNPNIPHEHPLKEWARMCVWLLALASAVWLAAGALVWALPYGLSLQNERKWFGVLAQPLIADARKDAAMQQLADELAAKMQIPAGSIDVYVSDSDTVDAFATFGGNVVMMQGLLDKLPSEEAVAAVLAHELGHIKNRDPLRSVSRSMLFGAVSAALFGADGSLNALGSLETLRYSRELEEAADEAALHAVAARYGSAGGAVEMLEMLGTIEQSGKNLQWISTHPHPEWRIAGIKSKAAAFGYAMNAPKLPNRWMQAKPPTEKE